MKRSLIFSLIATIAVLTVVGCDHDDQDQDQPSTMPSVDSEPAPANPNVIAIPAAVRQNLGITFVKPEYRRVTDTLRVPGRFELLPTARHEIRAPFGGRVELLVKQFDRVQAGEVIARINSPEWHRQQLELEEDTAEVTRARAELAIVQQSLVEGQGKVKLLEDRVARLQQAEIRRTELESELAAARNALPRLQAEIDAKVAAHEAAKHHLPLAERAIASQLGITRDQLLEEIDTPEGKQPRWQAMALVDVRAVDAGIVDSIAVTGGGRVESLNVILTTLDPLQLRVRAVALQSDLHRLRDAMPASILPPGGLAGAAPMRATLYISPDASPDQRTMDLILTPQSLQSWARPGVTALVEIAMQDAAEELAIPTGAIIQDGLQKVYFRRDRKNPDSVVRIEADLGTTDGRWVVVSSGLTDTDELVMDGIYELKLAGASQSGGALKGGHFHADGTWHADGQPEPGSKK